MECFPIGKNTALVHCAASAARTAGVLRGQGPSSKVSTTSPGRRKSWLLKCSKPKPGPPVVSISTTRETPSASGLAQVDAALLAAGGVNAAGAAAGATVAGMTAGAPGACAKTGVATRSTAGVVTSVTVALGAGGADVATVRAAGGSGTADLLARTAPKTAKTATIASAHIDAARRIAFSQPYERLPALP